MQERRNFPDHFLPDSCLLLVFTSTDRVCESGLTYQSDGGREIGDENKCSTNRKKSQKKKHKIDMDSITESLSLVMVLRMIVIMKTLNRVSSFINQRVLW